MVDLCYQTQALADIDPRQIREQIQNATPSGFCPCSAPDGQWSMRFEPDSPKSKSRPGTPCGPSPRPASRADNPQVDKAIGYLLGRQQAFGGWMDPLQSFENFKTPFRETQFAMLALQHLLPVGKRAKGWDSPPARIALAASPSRCCSSSTTSGITPRPRRAREMRSSRRSPTSARVRQAAAEALGRLALPSTRVCSRHCSATPASWSSAPPPGPCGRSTAAHPDDRRRRSLAALRLARATASAGAPPRLRASFRRPGDGAIALVTALLGLADDPVRRRPAAGDHADCGRRGSGTPAPRSAARSKTPCWPRSPSRSIRGSRANLRAAIYNLADENIRYLYNNWVALLAQAGGSRARHTRAPGGGIAARRSNSPACWSTDPTRRRSSCSPPWPKSRCAAATPTIWRLRPRQKSRRRSTAASATISSRLPSSAPAPPCFPARCCRCWIPRRGDAACSRATPA